MACLPQRSFLTCTHVRCKTAMQDCNANEWMIANARRRNNAQTCTNRALSSTREWSYLQDAHDGSKELNVWNRLG